MVDKNLIVKLTIASIAVATIGSLYSFFPTELNCLWVCFAFGAAVSLPTLWVAKAILASFSGNNGVHLSKITDEQLRQPFQNLIGNALKCHADDRPPRVSVKVDENQAAGQDIVR